MRIVLLGPVRALNDDTNAIDIGGVRLRMLLARLALDAGQAVSAAALIDGLWGEEPPADAVNALQALVSRLRKALRGAGALDSVPGGYRLAVRAEDVDAYRFEELAARGRRELAADRPAEAAAVLGSALALWRGAALADVLDAPFARNPAGRLDDLRATAAEDRFEAELRLGRHAEVLADLEAAGAEHPLRERSAALRMRALYAAGRQSEALAVYEAMRARLADELGVDPSAELRETHLALLRGELEQPAARPEAVPDHLPVRLTSFVGREEELTLLAELMAGSRLVTLVGAGGAGKTRLAIEAATRHRAHRRGRVWFVPLAGVRTPDLVADAVLGALGPRELRTPLAAGRPLDPVDRVVELLNAGESVLVLDNCEHLVDAAAEFAYRLLDRLPHLTILATSREPLAITGEALCRLGSLAVPAEGPELAEANHSAAVRLFVDRAAAVRPGFALDAATVDSVVEICRRLDGMPLAMELAAARLRAMSVDQIAQRLDDRFRLLGSGSRAALPRGRTLLAVVEWSWDLLEEPERVLARRLSAFSGGASLAALEAVCADDLLPVGDVLYVLGSLVEKSMVDASADGDPRYRMLETVRAYAADQLELAGERADVSARLVRHFLALVEEHDPLLRTGAQLRSMALFDAEHDNVLSALRSVLDAGEADTAARFVGALFWYWGIRGFSAQFEAHVAEVLRFGPELSEPARVAFRAVQLLAGAGVPEGADPESIRAILADCARTGAMAHYPALVLVVPVAAFFGGDDALGERELRRALDGPDPWGRACAHWVADYVRTDRGDWRTGADDRARALRGFEEVGDRWGLAMALGTTGQAHSLRGEYDAAIAAYERGVAVAVELGAEDDIAHYRIRLATERMRAGDLDGARRDIHAAQRQASDLGYRRMAAMLLFGLADLHRRSGELDAANAALDQVTAAAHRLALPAEMVADVIARARMPILLAAGAAAPARELLPRVVAASFGHRDFGPVAELLAGLLLAEGDPVGAAGALGMSEVVRGVFDEGNPELRVLIAELVDRLGEAPYREAYRLGAGMSRADALKRLTEESGPPAA